MKTLMCFFTLILLLIGCQHIELSEADKAEIQSSTKIFGEAIVEGDTDKIAALYSEDALLMPPNSESVKGKEKIKEVFSKMPEYVSGGFTIKEIDGGPYWAYVLGTYEFTIKITEDSTVVDKGKYIEIRSKQDSGEWLIHRDIFNSDVAW